jgi:hypothetical protein
MSVFSTTQCQWKQGLASGLILASSVVLVLVGCTQGDGDVASLRTNEPSVSAGPVNAREDLDQYGRTQSLEACLVAAGLPALLTPMDGGEAEIGWVEGHEVLARDFEQWTTILEGPAGEVDPAVHDAFTDVGVDPSTSNLEPALWVDGKDRTNAWIECLESSGYTNPTAYLGQDPASAAVWSQRYADAANDWIACARDHGLPQLADVNPEVGGSPLGPYVEVPLATEPELLRTVMEACPSVNEDVRRREADGDPTLEDDIFEGRVRPDPTIEVEEPVGMQEAANTDAGYDFESEAGKRYLELNSILRESARAFEEKYGREQAQKQAAGNGETPEK